MEFLDIEGYIFSASSRISSEVFKYRASAYLYFKETLVLISREGLEVDKKFPKMWEKF